MTNSTSNVRARPHASSSASRARPPSAHVDDQAAAKIPIELRSVDRWHLWKWHREGDRWKKPPFDPRKPREKQLIDPHDPSHWMSFKAARDLLHRGGDGIGFSLGHQGHDDLVGVDFDDCLDAKGHISNPDVQRWVEALDSYTEITPSKEGLRVWVHGSLPQAGRRNDERGVEIYAKDRYFTVTGRHLAGTPPKIHRRQKALDALWGELFGEAKPKPKAKANGKANGHAAGSDDELLAKARRGKNGAKFSSLFDVGDTSAYGDNESSADMALANMLAYWTDRDAARMEALFSRSALGQRPKWVEREDYRRRTIERAIADCRSSHSPPPGRNGTGGPEPSNGGDPDTKVNEAADDPHRLARIHFGKFKSRGAQALRFYRSAWLQWSDGAYRPVTDNELRCGLVRTIKAEFDQLNEAALKLWTESGGKDSKGHPVDKPHARMVTHGLVGNVILALESMGHLPDKAETPAWIDDDGVGQSNGSDFSRRHSNGNGSNRPR